MKRLGVAPAREPIEVLICRQLIDCRPRRRIAQPADRGIAITDRQDHGMAPRLRVKSETGIVSWITQYKNGRPSSGPCQSLTGVDESRTNASAVDVPENGDRPKSKRSHVRIDFTEQGVAD